MAGLSSVTKDEDWAGTIPDKAGKQSKVASLSLNGPRSSCTPIIVQPLLWLTLQVSATSHCEGEADKSQQSR